MGRTSIYIYSALMTAAVLIYLLMTIRQAMGRVAPMIVTTLIFRLMDRPLVMGIFRGRYVGIANEILMQIRSNKKLQSEVSLQDPIGVDREGNEIMLIDVIGNESESVVEEVELKMQVKKLYSKMKSILKTREKTVLELRYGLTNGNSKTQREIAKMLGISRSYVSRIEKKAIKKLSKELKLEL